MLQKCNKKSEVKAQHVTCQQGRCIVIMKYHAACVFLENNEFTITYTLLV